MNRYAPRTVSLAVGAAMVVASGTALAQPAVPEIPQVEVSYASLHAIDHTHIVIPITKGWDKDVGITITPGKFGTSVGADKIVSVLTAGTVDISSGSTVFSLAGYSTNSNYVDFMHGDIFQGFGFMVDPEAGYKSVTDFIDEGTEPKAAIKATAEQFRGKSLATLNEGGIRGFITIALESAGMSMDDITVNSFDTDSKIVAEMISGRADFAVGSAPGRVSMTLEGFVPVMTSLHISQFADATPDSKELRAVFHDGWATTRDYYANNKETLYRFASMIYRTLRLMVDRPQETIPPHTDFLNSIMGSTLTPADVEVIYEELNPFVPFEDQAMWYEDRYRTTNPEHYANITGAHIKLWEEQEVLEAGKWTPDNASFAIEFWHEMQALKVDAHAAILEARAAVSDATPKAAELLAQAEFHDSIYNFYDAGRFARAAAEWAAHESGS